jgi:(p)ppGpp synthase/HD superfamily hydrolase
VASVLALMPAEISADPRLAAFAARLPALQSQVFPAAQAAIAAAVPQSVPSGPRALAAVSEALAGLDAEAIAKLPEAELGAAAAAAWENVARAADASAPAAPAQLSSSGPSYYQKRYVFLQGYLYGKGYHTALRALEFARARHTGKRKDGFTPEFQHQVEIALYLSTLKDVRDEETTLAAALLHDVMEDYDVEREEMERLFGKALADTVWRLTKVHKGVKKDLGAYFAEIAGDPVASLVKAGDRIHNVQSMVGVFSPAKQAEYIEEVERWFLPMLKAAERAFPDQAKAYLNARHLLKSQLALLRPRPRDAAHFAKRREALNAYLERKGYAKALEALGFAAIHHRGLRQDGVTPALLHQVEVALFVSTLKGLVDEESAIVAALLHDVLEETDVERGELERLFGAETAASVWRLTKAHKGAVKDEEAFFAELALDPAASLVKGAARVHNVQTMAGVVSPDEVGRRVARVESHFLPMLKRAKYSFPEQTAAYMNLRHMLKSQLQLLRAALSAP